MPQKSWTDQGNSIEDLDTSTHNLSHLTFVKHAKSICCREHSMFKNCAGKTVLLLIDEEKNSYLSSCKKFNSKITENTETVR